MKVVNNYVMGITRVGVDKGELMMVLTQDETGKFAAYMGIVDLSVLPDDNEAYIRVRDEASNRIAHSGTKLTYQQMSGFFLGIAEENYRA